MGLIQLNSKFLMYQNTFMNSNNNDPDAKIYFDAVKAAGGILTSDEKKRILTFIISCKSTGEWSSMKAIYPMRGDGENAMSINLKTPGTFDLTFINTIAGDFSSSGWTGNRPNIAYARTNIFPAVDMDVNSAHVSYFSGTEILENSFEIGAFNFGTDRLTLSMRWSDDYNYSTCWNSTVGSGWIETPVSTSKYYSIMSRVSGIDFRTYKDGAQIGSTATSTPIGTQTPVEIYINTWSSASQLQNYISSKLCRFASIGDGLTETESSNLSTYVATLNSDR